MQKKTEQIVDILSKKYPNAKSELVFKNPYQLLVAVILSAQCTDKRVNKVTPALFAVADTPQKMVDLPTEDLEKIIFSCGFYHNKARSIKNMSADIIAKFDGQVPDTIESLMSLDGVGRKTANVVYAVGFGGQAIAVDTHVFRVSNRLGLAHATNVLQTEKQLMQELPQDKWSDCHHYILLHGRYVCKSAKPDCKHCDLTAFCDFYNAKTNKDV